MYSERKESLSEGISEPEFSYFEAQAYWGVTKHMGGLKATNELGELCRTDKKIHPRGRLRHWNNCLLPGKKVWL